MLHDLPTERKGMHQLGIYPIRGTFVGCCAAVGGAVLSNTVATSPTKIFLIIEFIFDVAPDASPLTPHRITLSARASTFGGNVRPICFAAFRLMMNSNIVGCSTGRSEGLAPLRILSTKVAARLSRSVMLTP
jgi:hypothetical protein